MIFPLILAGCKGRHSLSLKCPSVPSTTASSDPATTSLTPSSFDKRTSPGKLFAATLEMFVTLGSQGKTWPILHRP